MNHLVPDARGGKGIDENWNVVSLKLTAGSSGTGSANSVALKV